MHHRVRQFLIDGLTREATAVTREDVSAIAESVELRPTMIRTRDVEIQRHLGRAARLAPLTSASRGPFYALR